ncbi:uncharacterized protein [Fopius arisanus]|uniref:Uncharacterized protein n=1 Tax=Fopius arisanus TaxID=64838 RepID=A0A9R1TBW8_9HYME|nr:PREDICTED: uncharacterized protein LOC105268678 [Fopius arisanus]
MKHCWLNPQESVEKCQTQLFEAQNLNVQQQIILENERRTSRQMVQEVQAAVEVIGRLEDEKIRGQTERARLEINWDTSQAERSFLMDQARTLKLENVALKRRTELLEGKLQEGHLREKKIEGKVEDLKHQVTALQAVIKNNIEKLKKEQTQLFEFFQNLGEMNSKVERISRSILMNTRKVKDESQELKEKLEMTEMLQVPLETPPNISNTSNELIEFSEKFRVNQEIDDRLTELCARISSTCLQTHQTP